MRILVAGASGRVGTDLVHDLVAAGHDVVAASRNVTKFEGLDHVEPLVMDLHDDESKLQEQVRSANVEAIYFTAGSRGKDLLQVDAFGAIKLVHIADELNIMRFVMLSSMYATQPAMWSKSEALKSLTNYNIAKYVADETLINATLNYTIVQPATLMEEPATGRIAVDDELNTTIAIPDVAQTLADVLEKTNTYHQIILISAGTTPINDALDSIE